MICSDLSSIDWKQIESLSADEGYNLLSMKLKNVVEKHVPLKKTNKTFKKKKMG